MGRSGAGMAAVSRASPSHVTRASPGMACVQVEPRNGRPGRDGFADAGSAALCAARRGVRGWVCFLSPDPIPPLSDVKRNIRALAGKDKELDAVGFQFEAYSADGCVCMAAPLCGEGCGSAGASACERARTRARLVTGPDSAAPAFR